MDLDAYLAALASSEPAPGGGSAATLVGALAAALCAMVANITAAAPKHAAVRDDAVALVADAEGLRARFLDLRPLDEAAFAAVVAAQALPRSADEERAVRTDRIQAALARAAAVPLDAAVASVEVLMLAARAAALRNAHLASDVLCAMHFGRAAFEASQENVRVNHRYLHDARTVAEQTARLAALQTRALAAERTVREIAGSPG